MAAEATLQELAREGYRLMAALVLGEAAAADVTGYRDVHDTRCLEQCDSPAPHQQERSPLWSLVDQLPRLCPLLRHTPTDKGCSGEDRSGVVALAAAPSAPPATAAASPPHWLDAAADAVDALCDAVDERLDSAALATSRAAAAGVASVASVLPAAALGGRSLAEVTAALTGRTCIMAGLLLDRDVRLRGGPCYAPVASPMLVVLDLDGTLLHAPFSCVDLRATLTATAADVRALFVDADFLRDFCEAVTRHGHEVALCSLTEGSADQEATALTVAEGVLALLSRVLPATRMFLNSTDDVVCLPRSAAGPGKLYHLHELQQRRNARDERPRSRPRHTASPAPPVLPTWLSTDILLIDDDRANCELAVTQGYHAASCAETGMSAAWYAANCDVQVLLGLPASEVGPRCTP
ncbi:hypothetical protein NESM_000607000 [Novymonas esmeraldas]|uniref:FCP1 homology domain-containing protein n=1 Tax=Novymonas esmeraldas TaxID=1808958 RepID=A0AAW0EUL9_9TRYP